MTGYSGFLHLWNYNTRSLHLVKTFENKLYPHLCAPTPVLAPLSSAVCLRRTPSFSLHGHMANYNVVRSMQTHRPTAIRASATARIGTVQRYRSPSQLCVSPACPPSCLLARDGRLYESLLLHWASTPPVEKPSAFEQCVSLEVHVACEISTRPLDVTPRHPGACPTSKRRRPLLRRLRRLLVCRPASHGAAARPGGRRRPVCRHLRVPCGHSALSLIYGGLQRAAQFTRIHGQQRHCALGLAPGG